MFKCNNKGVTLIALVVTVIVIIILASISITTGSNLIAKSKVENMITNMLIIKSKCRVLEEEIEGKTWDYSTEVEEGAELSKKEQGRREIFVNEHNFILVKNADATVYNLNELANDSVYYVLEKEALSKMGLASLWEEGKSYYVIKYTVRDNKYEDINVYYTKGIKYNNKVYYDLDTLQNIDNE